jgi:hypothetical protein
MSNLSNSHSDGNEGSKGRSYALGSVKGIPNIRLDMHSFNYKSKVSARDTMNQDDQSDKSILGQTDWPGSGITQTKEIEVSSHKKSNDDLSPS